MTRIYLLCKHYDDYSTDEVINAFTSEEKAIIAGKELAKEPVQLFGNTYTDRKLWADYTEYCQQSSSTWNRNERPVKYGDLYIKEVILIGDLIGD